MWFDWDGEKLRFTHTNKRQKYRNIASQPRTWRCRSSIPTTRTAISEVRGVVEEIVPDPTGRLLSAPQRPLQRPADRAARLTRPTG